MASTSDNESEILNHYMEVIRKGILEIIARKDKEIDAKLSAKAPVEILMEAIDIGEVPKENRTVEAFRFDRCYLRKDRAALMNLYHCLAGILKITPSDIQTWIANGEEVVQDRVQTVFRVALGDKYPITPAEHLKDAIEADKIPTDPQTVADFCFDQCESDEVASELLDFYRCLTTLLKAPLHVVQKLIAVKQFVPFAQAKFIHAVQWTAACGCPDEEQADWITDNFDWLIRHHKDIFKHVNQAFDFQYAGIHEEGGVNIDTTREVPETAGCYVLNKETGSGFVTHFPGTRDLNSEPSSRQSVPAAASIDEAVITKLSSNLDDDDIGKLLAAYDWFRDHRYIFGPLNTTRDKEAVMKGLEEVPPDSRLGRSRTLNRDTRAKMMDDINEHAADGVHLAYLRISPHVDQGALLIYPGRNRNNGDDPERVKVVRQDADETETVVLVTDSYDEAIALARQARADFVQKTREARRAAAAASSTEETASALSSMTLEETAKKGEVASIADSTAVDANNDGK
ncbi:hypothetical protein CkaCkLH20_07278 [Colletotrichum karsti]|uniref:Uncharacterized protein n=1 Tax=Colletotrichum karsti TaxID=1095194 RepID=A0A9P6LJ95_9PEZI|nr:uncharacterized protein CkaCkLH20_07278 [Colletotrichum karsti]KAF9875458.1 hypothetical protein CkaCkLH20_07278 [Colletotrichum karsti]